MVKLMPVESNQRGRTHGFHASRGRGALVVCCQSPNSGNALSIDYAFFSSGVQGISGQFQEKCHGESLYKMVLAAALTVQVLGQSVATNLIELRSPPILYGQMPSAVCILILQARVGRHSMILYLGRWI